jgi:hypothetical protein
VKKVITIKIKNMKEIIKEKLERYGYNYTENKNLLDIKLDFSQHLIIDFSEKEKIKFNDKLKGWNFLTGIIEMSYKGAIIYQTIGLFMAIILLMFLRISSENLIIPFVLILVGFSVWVIIWSFYYLVKLENIKKQIVFWIENKYN